MKRYIIFGLILLSFASGLAAEVTTLVVWRHGETEANRLGLLSGGGPDDPNGITGLNAEGQIQARELGEKLYGRTTLDVIYTSDLSRAQDTAKAVLKVFEEHGQKIELKPSMQLREVLHGRYELSDKNVRNASVEARIRQMLDADERGETPDAELKDKYRFWKIHSLANPEDIVPGDVVDVRDYIARGECRPETAYQLWERVQKEFIRIAQENPGKTVGISTHGAVISTLRDGLKNPEGAYLPPYYQSKAIKRGDTVVIPAVSKIENAAFIYFKYDSRDGGKLELVED